VALGILALPGLYHNLIIAVPFIKMDLWLFVLGVCKTSSARGKMHVKLATDYSLHSQTVSISKQRYFSVVFGAYSSASKKITLHQF